MNALSCDPDGTLHDPFDGIADLKAGRVRFVGDPRARIEEDYLRLLRFFRFQAHYGHEPPAPAMLAVAMEMAPGLANLSGERLRQETLKLLDALHPLPALEAMIACGVAAHYLPEVESAGSLAAFLDLEDADAVPDPLLRLAALLPEGGAGATVARRLRLSRAETTRLIALTAPEAKPLPDEPATLRRRRIYYLGARRYGNLLRLGWARAKAAGETFAPRETLEAAIGEARSWTPKKFPLGGKDLLERGIPSSPRLGEILAEVEDWWIEGGFAADREACLARLDALVAAET